MAIIKSREIEISKEDPFEHDLLGRKESAEILTNFITSANDGFVLCLDAEWGQGKTTFLRMWQRYLEKQSIPTVYFNAWENDFSDDALVALIGELSAAKAHWKTGENESTITKLLDKTKATGGALIKKALPVAVKVATHGALDLDKATESSLATFTETVAKEQLEKYDKAKQSIQAFRESLQELVSNIAELNNDAEQFRPLVFIIDELDRCRPNYAIEILEKAKHFFNVNNIVFVLGADKQQLGSSFKAVYGEGLNVNGYLRRFMDYDFSLPEPERGKFIQALFAKHKLIELVNSKQFEDIKEVDSYWYEYFSNLFGVFNVTLREQEQCCSLFSICVRTAVRRSYFHQHFVFLLIVLKVKAPKLYHYLKTTNDYPVEILSVFEKDDCLKQVFNSTNGNLLKAYIVMCKANHNMMSALIKSIDELREDAAYLVRSKGVGILGGLIKRIEIAANFKND